MFNENPNQNKRQAFGQPKKNPFNFDPSGGSRSPRQQPRAQVPEHFKQPTENENIQKQILEELKLTNAILKAILEKIQPMG